MNTMANGLTYKRVIPSPGIMKQFAATLASHLRPNDVIVLTGDLGAGKTQFVQGVADGLGIRAQVTSPTFNILLAYNGGRLPLFHFDLYRLENESELADIGFDETLESDGVSFIEWGNKFPGALPYSYLHIHIVDEGDGVRTVYAHALGDSCRQLLFLWAKDSKARLQKTSLASIPGVVW